MRGREGKGDEKPRRAVSPELGYLGESRRSQAIRLRSSFCSDCTLLHQVRRAGEWPERPEQAVTRRQMRLSDPAPKLRDGLEDRNTAGHLVCRR
jgi:hypothetical protein